MRTRRCPHRQPECGGPNGLCTDCYDDSEYRVWTRHKHDSEPTLLEQLREDGAFVLCLLGLAALFVWLAGSTP